MPMKLKATNSGNIKAISHQNETHHLFLMIKNVCYEILASSLKNATQVEKCGNHKLITGTDAFQ